MRSRPTKTSVPSVVPFSAGTLVGMGWYRSQDWERLLQVISDRDQLHNTYSEWLAEAEWAERNIRATGHEVRRVFVDPDELAAWCLIRGRKPDGKTRAEFVTDKMERG